jgi:hypothetical protein
MSSKERKSMKNREHINMLILEGKSLSKISKLLNLSYVHVKQIQSRLKMKNDIEALRGFAVTVIDHGLSEYDAFLHGLVDKDGNKTEILTGSKDSLSDSQRRLYWAWMTDMSKTKVESIAGRTKEDWHWEMKERYLIPIFIRDDSEFAEMYYVYKGIIERLALTIKSAQTIKEKFLGDLSITDATPQQAIEYLNDIEQFCHSQGVMLRTDSNLYLTATGIK